MKICIYKLWVYSFNSKFKITQLKKKKKMKWHNVNSSDSTSVRSTCIIFFFFSFFFEHDTCIIFSGTHFMNSNISCMHGSWGSKEIQIEVVLISVIIIICLNVWSLQQFKNCIIGGFTHELLPYFLHMLYEKSVLFYTLNYDNSQY